MDKQTQFEMMVMNYSDNDEQGQSKNVAVKDLKSDGEEEKNKDQIQEQEERKYDEMDAGIEKAEDMIDEN